MCIGVFIFTSLLHLITSVVERPISMITLYLCCLLIEFQRVKVYRLNGDGKWEDQGTGHVSVDYLEVCFYCSFHL